MSREPKIIMIVVIYGSTDTRNFETNSTNILVEMILVASVME